MVFFTFFEIKIKLKIKIIFKYIWVDREFDSITNGMYFKNIFILKNWEITKLVKIPIFVHLNCWRPS